MYVSKQKKFTDTLRRQFCDKIGRTTMLVSCTVIHIYILYIYIKVDPGEKYKNINSFIKNFVLWKNDTLPVILKRKHNDGQQRNVIY